MFPLENLARNESNCEVVFKFYSRFDRSAAKFQSDHKSCGFETWLDLSIRPLIDIETAPVILF